jgi:hypothetical protein
LIESMREKEERVKIKLLFIEERDRCSF